jgi:MFS transporter, NNP family, nitrate/nitrite transporter
VAWFWLPLCVTSAGMAFIWMSNHPDHGNHHDPNITEDQKDNGFWKNALLFYWFEGVSLLCGAIAVMVLIQTRDAPIFLETAVGQIGHKFLLVLIAMILQHVALYYMSPKSTMPILRQQAQMFYDKHTYVMTFLYIMSFGSFIGFSGAFPKLITDLFGYVTADGCFYAPSDDDADATTGTIAVLTFVARGTEFDCLGDGGEWGSKTVTNPHAPNVFAYAWLGAFVGSVIRPVGGILADRHGGARLTHILIIWCTVATVCLGILVQKTGELEQPERNFALFVFLFLNIFLCTGAMNGTTFRTIGVLFDDQLAGPVLGWSAAVASYGGFVIPAMFGVSISLGYPETVMYCMAVFYAICGVVNYWYYGRPGAERPGV